MMLLPLLCKFLIDLAIGDNIAVTMQGLRTIRKTEFRE